MSKDGIVDEVCGLANGNSYIDCVDKQRSSLVSRNITVLGRRTSVRLEPEMWTALKDIARREKCTIHEICSLIQMRKSKGTSLTAAIRVFLMLYFRASSTEEGHSRAGHGNFENMKQRARMKEDNILINSSRLPPPRKDHGHSYRRQA